MGTDPRYKIDSHEIAYRIINQEGVILNLKKGKYYTLNKSGVVIWQNIIAGKSLAKILDALKSHFPEVERSRLANDLCALISDLKKERIIFKQKEAK